MHSTQQDKIEQEGKAIGPTSKKLLGGFTLNLPPVVDSSSIYELFYFNNGELDPQGQSNVLQKSLLINRTKHKAWEESNDYIATIQADKQNNIYYGFSNYGKIPCSMGANQEPSKWTALAYETHNNLQEAFSIAPTYKISFAEDKNQSELTINIYNEDINKQATDVEGKYYLYSYEKYLQERFGEDSNNKPKYKRNPNNQYCLTIPHAVSSKRIQNGKFLFNIGLLNAKPNSSCTIKFQDCDVDYNPTTLYDGSKAYPSSINSISTNTIFDVTSTTKDALFVALTSVNGAFKNNSFAGIFQDKHQYSKLQVKPKNTSTVTTIVSTKATVELTYTSSLPAEINDLKMILDTLRRWFDGPNSRYKTGYVFPSFSIQK